MFDCSYLFKASAPVNATEAKAQVKAWSTVLETARQHRLAAEERARQ
jgi:hypothetical protein